MNQIRYTLLSDGSSDRALIPILSWLLREHCRDVAIQSEWADLRRLPNKRRALAEKIQVALDLYPCDLLFIHRDAEKQPFELRVREIDSKVSTARKKVAIPPSVRVIPIRMQEAWLLLDESAIRHAVGNPHGQQPLTLPSKSKLEALPDPKQFLYNLLKEASGLSGRRLARLQVNLCAQRVPEFIESFELLRQLSAFQRLESELKNVICEQGWYSFQEKENSDGGS